MKNNKDGRIEIRLPYSIKEKFQNLAKQRDSTMSEMLLAYILKLIKEEESNCGIQD